MWRGTEGSNPSPSSKESANFRFRSRLFCVVPRPVPALLVAGKPLLPARGERLTLFWVGQLQVAGFLICSIIGLAILPAGRAIVLAYTMPLWALGRHAPINTRQKSRAAVWTGLSTGEKDRGPSL